MTQRTSCSATFKTTLIASAIAGWIASPLEASAAQVGSQFVVASLTPTLTSTLSYPTLATSPNGFVVGWATAASIYHPQPAYVSIFAPDGTPRNSNVALGNTLRFPPGVAMDADGDMVTSWIDPSRSRGYFEQNGTLYARRYSPAGVAQDSSLRIADIYSYLIALFVVNSGIEAEGPVVAMDDSGDFVVAWGEGSYNALGCFYGTYNFGCLWEGQHSKTYAASYRADDTANKVRARIDSVSSYYGSGKNGGLAALSLSNSGDIEAVFSRASANIGAPAPAIVKSFNSNIVKSGPSAFLPVIPRFAYTSLDAAGNIYALWFDGATSRISRFNPDGTSRGQDIVLLNSSPVGFGTSGLAVAPSGAFAFVNTVGNGEVDGQYFNADGTSNGASFVIDPGQPPEQGYVVTYVASALDSNGHLVVVWNGRGSSGLSIAGRTVSGP